jgi:hypothetical protein
VNLIAVRQGLAAAVDTIAGLRVFDYVPDSAPVPAAIVEPLEIVYGTAMRDGLNDLRGYVTVFDGRMSDRSSQDRVDAYVASSGASSIKAAIEADPTLSGSCQTSQVIGAQPRSVTMAGVEYNAYRFEVQIYG